MRNLPVGNGSLLVTFDELYQIRDIYFPHVGMENHTIGHPSRFGVWANGKFAWVSADSWQRELRYADETMVTDVRLRNEKLGLEIISNDTVLHRHNVFLRKLTVKNLRQEICDVRIFFHHDLRISENKVGDTAFFEPESQSLIHYKRDRYFLINSAPHFEFFTTGRKDFGDMEGTWRDAEDGWLSGGTITEGSVDSTIGVLLKLAPDETQEIFYWICAGSSRSEVSGLNDFVKLETPSDLLLTTQNHWRAWVNKNELDFADLPPEVVDLFKRSLLITRTQIDNGGAILAANDSEVAQRATDHYSYLWTRDGALVAYALDLAGFPSITRAFFEFCGKIIEEDGYFLQKYNADGSRASGWHSSWDAHKKQKLMPIQEDETALVIWALWKHYDEFRDLEFVSNLYRSLIIRAADFMCRFRDENLKLPAPSWNLWEDRRGIHTFTCAAVFGGLQAAANFARLFNETERAEKYESVAQEIKTAMREYLYSEKLGYFVRALMPNEREGYFPDTTLDASIFGAFYFGAFAADDEILQNSMRAVENRLSVKTEIGGIARFENDGYMQISGETDKIAGNAWFICTLWLAEFHIARAKSKDELAKALEILEWTVKRALPSGVLAEQIHPFDGSPVSVSPLTWSHSSYIAVVMNYLRKWREFENDFPDDRRRKR